LIPESFIQELLARVDIADVVGRYVPLRKGGANLLGLCPFHNEKSPSFTVSPTKQFYHCFGCGANGSAITFLMEHTGASFPDAVRTLAGSAGMTVPEEERGPRQKAEQSRRKEEVSRHTRVLDAAQLHYLRELRASTSAIEYLKGRGLTGVIAAQFGLGWSGTDRHGLAKVFEHYEDAVLVEAGLVIESDDGRRYDRFRERIMFPIRNSRGDLVGFGGRIIGKGEPKYLNSPETPVFSKGQELYGLWEAKQAIRKEGQVLVVEGYMDVVGLAQLGIGNAVATLGTATTPDHIKKLLRASDRVIFSFDGDKAGKKAAWRALLACLPMLRDDISIRFLFLPTEHDPDSYVREFGAEAFRAHVGEAQALSRFLLDELAQRHPLEEAEGRASCVHEARPLIATIPECALRLQIEREFAKLVRLTPDELTKLLAQTPARPFGAPFPVPGAVAASGGSHAQGAQASGAAQAPASSEREGLEPPNYDGIPDFPYDEGMQSGGQEFDPYPGGGGYDNAPPSQGEYGRGGGYGQGGSKRNFTPGGKGGRDSGNWKGKRFENRDQGVIEPRRPVPTLAKRLLRLVLAHPELVDHMGEQQLEVLDNGPHLSMVRELIVLTQTSGARHVGALLEAADPESDLATVLRGLRVEVLAQEDLPDPQAEWNDALNRIEFDSLRLEIAKLAATGLSDDAARQRYLALSQRLAALKRAGSP
jgi:DNA primase